MASRATLQRQRSAEKVMASGRSHREHIRKAMAEQYHPAAGENEILRCILSGDYTGKIDS